MLRTLVQPKTKIDFRTRFVKGLQPLDTGHNIHTPFSLCDRILKKIKPNSHQTFAVFYTIEFAITLIEDFGIDPKNIWLFGDSLEKKKIANHLGINYNEINPILEEYKFMKFDVVLLNPPYQKGRNRYFYQEFVNKAWGLSKDIVCAITPSNWTSGTKFKSKFTKKIFRNKLTYYEFLGDKAFNAQLLVVYFITSKLTDDPNTILEADGTKTILPRNEINYFPTSSGNGESVISKLLQFANQSHLKEIHGTMTTREAVPSHSKNAVKWVKTAGYAGEELEWTLIDPTDRLVGFGDHKVIVTHQTSIGKLGVLKYAGPEFGIGLSAHAFVVKSQTQAMTLIKYLESPVVKFIVKTLKGSVCSNSQTLFNKIPMVDLSKTWTKIDLYQYFKLTPEEIKFINDTISN